MSCLKVGSKLYINQMIAVPILIDILSCDILLLHLWGFVVLVTIRTVKLSAISGFWRSRRLAQLVAHPLDVREVTSSSLVSSTIDSALKSAESFYFQRNLAAFTLKKLGPIWSSTHIEVSERGPFA